MSQAAQDEILNSKYVTKINDNGIWVTQPNKKPTNFYPYTETSGYLDGGTVQIFITAGGELRVNPVAGGTYWGGIMYLAAN